MMVAGRNSDSCTPAPGISGTDPAGVVSDSCHHHGTGVSGAVKTLERPFSGTSYTSGLSLPKHFHWTIHGGNCGSKTRQTFAVKSFKEIVNHALIVSWKCYIKLVAIISVSAKFAAHA